jgi:hypothetical protein
MDAETRNRLLGLNSLLADLFQKRVLISGILKKSGFTKSQVEKIRAKHLDIFLRNVCQNLYHYINKLLPERYAKAIKYCYYLDGQKPNNIKGIDKQSKIARRRISQLQSEAISSLKDKDRMKTFNRIFATAAKDALRKKAVLKPEKPKPEPERELSLRDMKRKYGLRKKKAVDESYDLPERPPHLLSEAQKAKLLKRAYKKKRVPARVFEKDKPQRKMFNPWLGEDRYKSNWW